MQADPPGGFAAGLTRADRLGIVATLAIGLAVAGAQVAGIIPAAYDAGAYWAAQPGNLYQPDWGLGSGQAAFLYSPAFADLLLPARIIPERLFAGLWQLGLFAILAVTLRRWAVVLILAGVPALLIPWPAPLSAMVSDIALGNIQVLLGAIAVWGLRWPALWSIALVSKVTPGVGLVWFAARREWRHLAIALATTAAVVAVSFAYRPGDWFAWADFLLPSMGHEWTSWVVPVPLVVRLSMSAALIWWAGRTDRAWAVPVGVAWAIPVPYWTMFAVMAFALAAPRRPTRRAARPERSLRPL